MAGVQSTTESWGFNLSFHLGWVGMGMHDKLRGWVTKLLSVGTGGEAFVLMGVTFAST